MAEIELLKLMSETHSVTYILGLNISMIFIYLNSQTGLIHIYKLLFIMNVIVVFTFHDR